LSGGDTRVAWTGNWPGTTRPLRIEGASWHSKPVFFSLIGDWTKPQRAKGDERTIGDKVRSVAGVVLLFSMVLAAAFLARRNYLQGRGDRSGAARLAFVMLGLEMALWLCRSHFVPDVDSFFLFVLAVSTALCVAGATWLFYLAVEPWVRRKWPQTIISWSRLLSGQVRDPLVGRDLLIGLALGPVLILLTDQLHVILPVLMGAEMPPAPMASPGPTFFSPTTSAWLEGRWGVAGIFAVLLSTTYLVAAFSVFFFLLQRFLRWRAGAIVVAVLFMTAVSWTSVRTHYSALGMTLSAAAAVAMTVSLDRLGPVVSFGAMVMMMTYHIYPFTLDPMRPYFTLAITAVAVLVGIAVLAATIACGRFRQRLPRASG